MVTKTKTVKKSINTDTPEYQEPKGETKYYEREKYGVMFSRNYEWDPVECVKRAYGKKGRGRSLHFHTDLLEKEKALKCIKEVPHYNYFDPINVAAQLEKMPEDIKISVGRESSPVLYIWTGDVEKLTKLFKELEDMQPSKQKYDWASSPDEYAICPAEKFPHVIGDSLEPLRDCESLEKIVKKAKEVSDGGKVLVRAWWD